MYLCVCLCVGVISFLINGEQIVSLDIISCEIVVLFFLHMGQLFRLIFTNLMSGSIELSKLAI